MDDVFIYLISHVETFLVDRVYIPRKWKRGNSVLTLLWNYVCVVSCVVKISVPFVHPTRLAIGILRNRTLYLDIHNPHRTRAKLTNPHTLQRIAKHLHRYKCVRHIKYNRVYVTIIKTTSGRYTSYLDLNVDAHDKIIADT